MVRIDIKALRPGLYEYDWKLDAEAIDLDPNVFKALHAQARLDYHVSRIYVTLNVNAEARLVCDRTLAEFDQPVEGTYSVLFSGPEFFEGSEEEEDIRLLAPDMEELDLTDAVRDTFLLALPQRQIAPGAEEEDIPMRFGVPSQEDAALDPRWDALRALQSDVPEE